MASQLCSLWGKDDVAGVRPAHLGLFLDAVLTFTMHSSLTLVQLANTIWVMMFKHEHIKTDSLLLTYVPKYVENTAPKIVKVFLISKLLYPPCILIFYKVRGSRYHSRMQFVYLLEC
jgi:hypothetical protein